MAVYGMPEDNRAEVALLAEGVDRNACTASLLCCIRKVALLAEGVDRNSSAAA